MVLEEIVPVFVKTQKDLILEQRKCVNPLSLRGGHIAHQHLFSWEGINSTIPYISNDV